MILNFKFLRNNLSVLFLLISILVFSQNKITNVTVVKQDNDTLKVAMDVYMTRRNGEILVDDYSFHKQLTIVDAEGKKLYVLRPNEIKEVSFLDLNGNKRLYTSIHGKNKLRTVVYNGKIKLYKEWTTDGNWNPATYYEFVQENGLPVRNAGGGGSIERKLLKITESKPELKDKIKNMGREISNAKIAEILKEFEEN